MPQLLNNKFTILSVEDIRITSVCEIVQELRHTLCYIVSYIVR